MNATACIRNLALVAAITLVCCGCATSHQMAFTSTYESLPDGSIVSGTLQDNKGSLAVRPNVPTLGPMYDVNGHFIAAAGVVPVDLELTWKDKEGGLGSLHVTCSRSPMLDGKAIVYWLGDQNERGFYIVKAPYSSGHFASGACWLLKARSDTGIPVKVANYFRGANMREYR